ncbi:MAG: hypothetical protein PGN34_23990 [Methylobacterium frigidaeris]
MRIVWTPAALADIEQTMDCIAQTNPTAAHRVAATISRQVIRFSLDPFSVAIDDPDQRATAELN